MAENKEIIENYLRDKGLNDKAIAGVMGNIQHESNFSTTATNRSSGAYGLFQWLGSRKTGLENYAKVTGRSKDDINTQLDYFWNELETTESKTKSVLLDSNYNSASEYAKAFEKTFERSGGSALAKRQTYAETIYSNMNSKTTGTGFGGTSGKIDPASKPTLKDKVTNMVTDSIASSIGLEWWGDIVVVLLAIILLIMGVWFIGLSITSNNMGVNVLNKIKGGGKSG